MPSTRVLSTGMFVLFSCLLLLSPPAVCLAQTWEGWDKREFKVDGRSAFLITPKEAAVGKPWIWRTEFFGHEPQADIALLKYGFHVAYIDLQNLYGAPTAMIAMDAMYDRVTTEYELSRKTVLEGFSRGGLFSLNWASRNPDKVACIYNDAPVCDFKSWPGGKGRGKGSGADWERCKKAYGLSEEEALAYEFNPVDQLEALAKAKVSILHVCGETDDVVPIEENSLIIQKRYAELGGSFTLISKPHCNHHPHSLHDPTRIVNFVLTHTGFHDLVTEATTPYGYDYFELRDGLNRCRAKFEKEKVGRVAFLGGSITAAKGWRDFVCEELQRRFPETEFDFVNAGISSLGSTPGAFRFERDVLARGSVDLLFEEAAVNDDTNGFSDVEQVRGMEGIVRQARLANPDMDIVLLHFADPGKLAEIRGGRTPAVIANHEKVAEHYRVASINLAKEVAERIHAGEFTWEKDFKDLHPAPFGHALYAKSIARLFSAARNEPLSHIAMATPELPAPIDPASYFRGHLVGPAVALAKQQAVLDRGWKLESPWTPKDKAGTRAGFVGVPALVGDTPGAVMKLTFHGVGIGVFVASGPDAGALEFRIDDGEWQTCQLFTQWSPTLHLPWAKMLASELTDESHEIELRIADQSDERSQGHAVRIIHFLVNGNVGEP